MLWAAGEEEFFILSCMPGSLRAPPEFAYQPLQRGAMSYGTRAVAPLFVFIAAGCVGGSEQSQAGSSPRVVASAQAASSAAPPVYGVLHSQIPTGAADGQVYEYH